MTYGKQSSSWQNVADMKADSIVGIRRDTRFSPNQVGNDEAIFSAVARWLEEAGHRVRIYSESEFLAGQGTDAHLIFTMLRSKAAVAKLQEWERSGGFAINSGFGIPYPVSWICRTAKGVPPTLHAAGFRPCWVKRADAHTIHREDVAYAGTEEELVALLARCAARGVESVVINEHIEGDLLKFYGVADSGSFFHWFYPQASGHSKFGLEAINGLPRGIRFDEEALRYLCRRAADALQIQVYGGDCIVTPGGQIYLIDLNDWPSFTPCRQEAAAAIGRLVQEKYRDRQENTPAEGH